MSEQESRLDLEAMRHTAAHVLAAASQKLRPETRLGVGPAIDDGFYHDIDVDQNYTEEDLKALEKQMKKIQAQNLPITHRMVSKDEARQMFANDPFKLELIDEIPEEEVGISDMGDGFFITLCRGGHVPSTKDIGHFKLTRLAGVYWKGDESRQQLQRIYGVLFPTKEELDEYLKNLDEAKKRDHRKLGQQLDLFTFSPLVGPGLPLFTPRGTIIREELQNFIYAIQAKHGYQRVSIPHLAKPDLYKTSGHWDKFADDIFHVTGKNDNKFVIKPMNCPHHTQVYAGKPRSYRDLPLRYSEVTMMYRDEQAGQLQGLSRVRSITIDDGHVFCRPDQIEQEIDIIMSMIDEFYSAFDFELSFRLSLSDPAKPEQYLGDRSIWDQAETALRDVLMRKGVTFTETPGEAAFYGPKIDFVARDSLKRDWQLATIQLDFNQPHRFGLTYTDESGNEMEPVMVHRAITGSFERFMSILLEHYAGSLPVWLSPTQTVILPIADSHKEFAEKVALLLKEQGIRAEVDDRSLSVGKKIREAEVMRVPVMLVVGDKEIEANSVAVRTHGNNDQGVQSVETVVQAIVTTAQQRKQSLEL